jgi:putative transposase
MKSDEAYLGLPAKVSQQVLRVLDKNWQSYFAATSAWEKNPDKFLGQPKLPKYKHKTEGRNLLVYTIQAVSKPALERGCIKPSKLPVEVKTNQTQIDQVRIVPKKTHYVVEVVYTSSIEPAELDSTKVAGIDIGLNNLAAVTSNKPAHTPVVVNGRPLKSVNQYYNKRKAQLQSQLKNDVTSSHRIERLTDKRNRKIDCELHRASRFVIDHLVEQRIGNLVIGKNDNWKQEIQIGKRNNQNFVSIPHARFVLMLSYKAQLVGINVVTIEESYTSKCSFLDLEPIEKCEGYQGKRIKRGLFRSGDGTLINADVNGAYNIIRKEAPNAFADGVEGVVVHPVKVTL